MASVPYSAVTGQLRLWRSVGSMGHLSVMMTGDGVTSVPRANFHVSSPILAKANRTVTLKPPKVKKYPKIYTKTGDKGKSSLFTGERRPKDDMVFVALGSTDELTSHIGLAMEFAAKNNHPYVGQLQRVQCILQDIGSCVATPISSARSSHLEMTSFSGRHTADLEEWIDKYSLDLPPLENFILPGGGIVSAQVHVARSVCRRAERCVSPLVAAQECDPEALRYLNRLSDFLFTIARLAARIDKKEETVYTRPVDANTASYKMSTQDGIWKKESTGE